MAKKKKYMVVARDKRTALTGLTTQRGGHRAFGRKTQSMWLSDRAEAEEIDHKYGMKGRGDVFVVEDEKYSYALNGEQWDMKFGEKGGELKTVHHYTFTAPDLSHFRTPKAGDRKRVGETTYEYTEIGGKLRLVPLSDIPRGTRVRRNGAEVTNGPNP